MAIDVSTPADFAAYWADLDQELDDVDARPVLNPLPIRSNEYSTVYGLRLTSVGPYRIFGYYSIPTGEGPFPGLLLTPTYGSVNHVPDYTDRMRYVCLQVMHRGQRLADQPYAARYPGLLTDGIDNPKEYVYRGILADCLRAAEFLLSREEVDANRVAIAGDDLGLITAARRRGFHTVMAADLKFYRLMEARQRTSAYPIEEINDYLRVHPDKTGDVAKTVALFDPVHFARDIGSQVILSVGNDGSLTGKDWLAPLIDSITGEVDQYALTYCGGTDHDALDARLARSFGVEVMTRFRRHY